jgi:apolipoprotein N-acyltransferase
VQVQESGKRRPLLIAALLLVTLTGWGAWRRNQISALPPTHHLRVGLIQGNIEQDKKWDKEFQEETLSRYERLSRAAAANGADLIVWPETAVPFFFQSDIHYQQWLLDLIRELHVPFLFGAVGWQPKSMNDVTLSSRLLSSAGGCARFV